MPITCLVCNREFAKQINNTHLKSHGMSAEVYKTKFNVESLLCPQYREELRASRSGQNNGNWGKKWSDEKRDAMSEKTLGRTPWNKDLSIGSTPEHAAGIARREARYASGELIRNAGGEWTDERRGAHSTTMCEWNNNRTAEERSASALLAVETKRERGVDLAPFRNQHHSDETKRLIGAASTRINAAKAEAARIKRQERIAASGLTLLSQADTQLRLRCTTCSSEFTLTQQCFTHSKWKSDWCNICYPLKPQYRSTGEREMFEWVQSLRGDAIATHRQLLSRRGEVDIWVPSEKLAIEYNGLYWHSADQLLKSGKSATADAEKRKELVKFGIRYVGIFEDEWLHAQEIVKSRLRNILGVTPRRIGARLTTVRDVSSRDAAQFCRSNHISGAGRSNVRYGLYLDDELISVMTFSRSNLSRRVIGWEINRYCTVLNTTVIGGATRLFKKFVADHKPSSVISYADSRWSEGELYRILGFKFVHQTVPNYWYVRRGTTHRIHRYTLRKTKEDDQHLSERELRAAQGYDVVYDCGSTKWLWEA